MIVMMMASTPSLKASRRPRPMAEFRLTQNNEVQVLVGVSFISDHSAPY